MNNMFYGCYQFNADISNWNVENVTNMNNMFNRCNSFNQDISNWNVANVTQYSNIFDNCPIDENNKPRRFRTIPPIVNPNQVHRESSKINLEQLICFFERKGIPKQTDNFDYKNFITDKLWSLFLRSGEQSNIIENSIQRILNERLQNFDYNNISPNLRLSIYYALKYVLEQPTEFINIYIISYTYDCINAYNGANVLENMTCINGAIERLILSIVPAATSVLSIEPIPTGANIDDYTELISIINATPKDKLIKQYIHAWYKEHNITNNDETNNLNSFSLNERKANLRKYLLNKFHINEENEENEENELISLINAKITETETNIGFEDDSFMYGGKKRKTKKKKKNKSKSKKSRIK
jgi:surface protein